MNVGSIDMGITSPISATVVLWPRQEIAPQGQTEPTANSRQLQQMVEEMQDHIKRMNVSLSFSTYGENGQNIAISVVNKDTGEVIREIPPKELRNLYAKMSELAGMIFNSEA